MQYCYFFPEDLAEFDRRIQVAKEKAQEVGQDIGKSCEQGAETYHDNAPYEEAVRAFEFYSLRIHDLEEIVNQAQVISPPSDAERVAMGTTVVILDLDTQEQTTLRIGSFVVFTPNHISYRSPLAKMLIGASIGHVREGNVGNKRKRFQVLDIRL